MSNETGESPTVSTKPDCRKIVHAAVKAGWERLAYDGYAVYRDRILPAVRALTAGARSRADRLPASDGWYLLGDLYSYGICAKFSAARAYRRAVALHPGHAKAWDELTDLLDQIGDYRGAVRAWRRTHALLPNGVPPAWWTNCPLTELEASLKDPGPPIYERSESDVVVGEALARCQPKRALRAFQGRRGIDAAQQRARAYGAVGDSAGVMREWRRIGNGSGPVYVKDTDWFAFPDEVWDSPELWRLMARIAPRLDGDLPGQAWAKQVYPYPRGCKYFSSAARAVRARRFRLVSLMRAAYLAEDIRALEAICARHPRFEHARGRLRKLRAMIRRRKRRR